MASYQELAKKGKFGFFLYRVISDLDHACSRKDAVGINQQYLFEDDIAKHLSSLERPKVKRMLAVILDPLMHYFSPDVKALVHNLDIDDVIDKIEVDSDFRRKIIAALQQKNKNELDFRQKNDVRKNYFMRLSQRYEKFQELNHHLLDAMNEVNALRSELATLQRAAIYSGPAEARELKKSEQGVSKALVIAEKQLSAVKQRCDKFEMASLHSKRTSGLFAVGGSRLAVDHELLESVRDGFELGPVSPSLLNLKLDDQAAANRFINTVKQGDVDASLRSNLAHLELVIQNLDEEIEDCDGTVEDRAAIRGCLEQQIKMGTRIMHALAAREIDAINQAAHDLQNAARHRAGEAPKDPVEYKASLVSIDKHKKTAQKPKFVNLLYRLMDHIDHAQTKKSIVKISSNAGLDGEIAKGKRGLLKLRQTLQVMFDDRSGLSFTPALKRLLANKSSIDIVNLITTDPNIRKTFMQHLSKNFRNKPGFVEMFEARAKTYGTLKQPYNQYLNANKLYHNAMAAVSGAEKQLRRTERRIANASGRSGSARWYEQQLQQDTKALKTARRKLADTKKSLIKFEKKNLAHKRVGGFLGIGGHKVETDHLLLESFRENMRANSSYLASVEMGIASLPVVDMASIANVNDYLVNDHLADIASGKLNRSLLNDIDWVEAKLDSLQSDYLAAQRVDRPLIMSQLNIYEHLHRGLLKQRKTLIDQLIQKLTDDLGYRADANKKVGSVELHDLSAIDPPIVNDDNDAEAIYYSDEDLGHFFEDAPVRVSSSTQALVDDDDDDDEESEEWGPYRQSKR